MVEGLERCVCGGVLVNSVDFWGVDDCESIGTGISSVSEGIDGPGSCRAGFIGD